MKTIEGRIAYYVRKVAQHTGIHPSKRRNPYRHDRLMSYKRLLQAEIEREVSGRL